MLACLVCRCDCNRALSESDSEDNGNPYRSLISLDPLEQQQQVAVLFDDISRSDSLEDDTYYDEFIVLPRQNAQQCVKLLEIARKESNDALIGPVDTQQQERIALTYEQAIGAAGGSLKRKIIREYDRVLAHFPVSEKAERDSRAAHDTAMIEQLDQETRCQAYRLAIRATSVLATKRALKKEYNAYLMRTRARV